MTIGVHQPYFFPYLPYFQTIKAVDKFVLLEDVNYINKGYINRNDILGSKFTIPLKGASQNKLINELEVMDKKVWMGEFLDKIVKAYTGYPYFTNVWLILERVLMTETNIAKINLLAIKEVCAYLDIQTQIVSSTAYPKNAPGQYRILEICKQDKATRYINAIGGKELYNKELFSSRGIELKFIHGTNSLSMIDLMMRYSQDDIKHLLHAYELE
jgi:hypothetical protein